MEELHVLLGRDCLPGELGGLLQYDHDAWFHRCKVCDICRSLLSAAVIHVLDGST